jgi:glycosyltransferase involved in cell wall biosynthesis
MRKILIVIPFPVYPLTSGGALRYFHLVREIARAFDVVVVVLNGEDALREKLISELPERENFINVVNVASSRASRSLWQRILDRARCILRGNSVLEPTNTASLALADQVENLLNHFSPDAAVLVELESLMCSIPVRNRFGSATIIVDMANVNQDLLAQSLISSSKVPQRDTIFRRIQRKEASLFRFVDGVFACSRHDCERFEQLNHSKIPSTVIPNGVDSELCCFDQSPEKYANKNILFCGNLSYEPNINGLSWFHEYVWPNVRSRCADARLTVVGKGLRSGDLVQLHKDDSVDVVGEVEELRAWYQKSGISICPLRIGSGTRLKVLEAMSYGNPMVSTSIGCEGIAVEDGMTMLIRDDADQFADAILDLLHNPVLFDELRHKARGFVAENYEWKTVGRALTTALENSIQLRRKRRE